MKEDKEMSMQAVGKTIRKNNHGQAMGEDEIPTNSVCFSSV